jgi:hypothetical protein
MLILLQTMYTPQTTMHIPWSGAPWVSLQVACPTMRCPCGLGCHAQTHNQSSSRLCPGSYYVIMRCIPAKESSCGMQDTVYLWLAACCVGSLRTNALFCPWISEEQTRATFCPWIQFRSNLSKSNYWHSKVRPCNLIDPLQKKHQDCEAEGWSNTFDQRGMRIRRTHPNFE